MDVKCTFQDIANSATISLFYTPEKQAKQINSLAKIQCRKFHINASPRSSQRLQRDFTPSSRLQNLLNIKKRVLRRFLVFFISFLAFISNSCSAEQITDKMVIPPKNFLNILCLLPILRHWKGEFFWKVFFFHFAMSNVWFHWFYSNFLLNF